MMTGEEKRFFFKIGCLSALSSCSYLNMSSSLSRDEEFPEEQDNKETLAKVAPPATAEVKNWRRDWFFMVSGFDVFDSANNVYSLEFCKSKYGIVINPTERDVVCQHTKPH